MPSSSCSSRSSSLEIIDAAAFSSHAAADPVLLPVFVHVHPDAAAAAADSLLLPGFVADHFASSLRTQEAVDAVCERHGVPREFAARPAGGLRACSLPPPGCACVYAGALEAGMRVPLHPFACELLGHLGLAPGQISPNGWRIVAGFVVLVHHAGVPPSLAVFRHFFVLSTYKLSKGSWFTFKGRAGKALFAKLPVYTHEWRERFFFLSSPAAAPWPCQVRWSGALSRSSTAKQVLTTEEKESARKVLDAHCGKVDLRTYLSESNLGAGILLQHRRRHIIAAAAASLY